jgi:hypothetical protein
MNEIIFDEHKISWITVITWSNHDLVGRRNMRLGRSVSQHSEVGRHTTAKTSMSIQVHFLGWSRIPVLFSVHLEYRFMSSVHQESCFILTFIRNPASFINRKSCSSKLSSIPVFITKYVVVDQRAAAWALEACPAAVTIKWRQGPLWTGCEG